MNVKCGGALSRVSSSPKAKTAVGLSNFTAVGCLIAFLFTIVGCTYFSENKPVYTITPGSPTMVSINVSDNTPKRFALTVDNHAAHAMLSVYHNDVLLIDNINLSEPGRQTVSALVLFDEVGEVNLTFRSLNAAVDLIDWKLEDTSVALPFFRDIAAEAGMDKVASIKYGGPSVADIDQDGDYDFVVNNHNAESSKIYWNNGDGTVTKHANDLARWFMQDLHGTALADYDKDGDLDLMLTRGGANGTTPSVSYFYVNDESNFVRFTGDAGINKGGRGRGARWSDMDLDGDLDLLIMNEISLAKTKPQHVFFENIGEGRFAYKRVAGIEDVIASRTLVTDFNGDGIDDFIMYGPLSLWQGNGDFTYTNVTDTTLPSSVRKSNQLMAITDIDIDNDGDLDLYLARGKAFEHGFGEAPSVDFDPIEKTFAIKTRGYKGRDTFSFTAEDSIKLTNYYFLGQAGFRGKPYPVYLGKNKIAHDVKSGDEFTFHAAMANGWPEERTENGVYIGYVGNGQWNAELVRNGNIFWSYFFTLEGVSAAQTAFEPENRNIQNILLENRNGQFVDVSSEWQIPRGGNALGVTTGDFNNDSHQDLLVYRWGRVDKRIADIMLLNTGKGAFEAVTMHGASDHGGPGYGDMGQAFDFNLDGHLDILSGSEHGYWYLYENQANTTGDYVLVNVGYSPLHEVDALGAYVTLLTDKGELQRRIGSAGEVFSQSFLNTAHVGLGENATVKKLTVRWRNGETQDILNPQINRVIKVGNATTKKASPHAVFAASSESQREAGTSQQPFIRIEGKQAIAENGIDLSKPLTLTVHYNTGPAHKIVAADEGGMQFWLRHRSSGLIPVEDRIEVDASVLYTSEGSATATIDTTGLTPTAELKNGEYYTLRVVFTSSDGNMYEDSINRVVLY